MNRLLRFSVFVLVTISLCVGILPVFRLVGITDVIAKADGTEYLRVINSETPFYAENNLENMLFYLPYTYYVKVLDENGYTVHAEISGQKTVAIDGYVKADELFYDGLTVTNPYPDIVATTAVSATLFQDKELTIPTQYVFPSRTMTVYGAYPETPTDIVYYVSYNGKLGYVKESDLVPFAILNHPNPLTFIKTEEPPTEKIATTKPESEAISTLRIIIIGCLVLAGIISLVFAMKKKPKREYSGGYYDENDYE